MNIKNNSVRIMERILNKSDFKFLDFFINPKDKNKLNTITNKPIQNK